MGFLNYQNDGQQNPENSEEGHGVSQQNLAVKSSPSGLLAPLTTDLTTPQRLQGLNTPWHVPVQFCTP